MKKKENKNMNTEITINEEKFIIESKEAKQLIKEYQDDNNSISSGDISNIIKTLKRCKNSKSMDVQDDIQELYDMLDYVEQVEEEDMGKDSKYEAIINALDLLIGEHVYGGAVALAKWAESQGYNLNSNSEKLEVEEKADFCKNYTGSDAWFGPSKNPHQKELDYMYTHRYGNKKGE